MGRTSLSPWLADFLSAEVVQVIKWKNSLNQNIKADPESRFEDDGSNFRSTSTEFPPQRSLQLIEILSVSDHPTVVVSDGVIKVKARLSPDTVNTLEDEAGTQFGFDTTNDVFQPKKVTVISTPFGTPDGFIQLLIDGIEYEHHLRRVEGHPSPVQDNITIQFLLDQVKSIRGLELASAEAIDNAPTRIETPPFVPRAASPQPPAPEPVEAPITIAVPQSSPPAPVQNTQFHELAFQTQSYARRKHHGPSLAADGIEVETGVNLQRPLQAASDDTPRTNAGSNPLSDEARSAKLLNLFSEMKGGKRLREPSPPEEQSPRIVSETPARATSNDARAQGPIHQPHFREMLPSNTTPTSAQPPPQQTQVSLPSYTKLRVPYGRRKIPDDQRNLLDRKDCWVPSLPGQSFPAPSIPISLLKEWNFRRQGAGPASSPAVLDEADGEQSMDVSDENSESDKEFTASQWPTSSPPQGLPPDSSFDKVIHGSPPDDLEVAAPHAMSRAEPSLVHPAQRRPLQHSPRADDGTANGNVLAHRPPKDHSYQSPRARSPSARVDSWRPSPTRYDRNDPSSSRRSTPRNLQQPDRLHSANFTHQAMSNGPGYRPTSAHSNYRGDQSSPSRWERQATGATRLSGHSSFSASQHTPTDGPRHFDSVSRSQTHVTESTKRSSWHNQPMVGRRRTGEYACSPGAPGPSTPGLAHLAYFPPIANGTADAAKGNQSSTSSTPTVQRTSALPNSRISATPKSSAKQTDNEHSSPKQQSSRIPPDEQYRTARREHMDLYRRRDWIVGSYRPDPFGNDTIATMLQAYKAHQNDTSGKRDHAVTPENFWRAARAAFPDHDLPHNLNFSAKAVSETTTSTAGANNQMQDPLPWVDPSNADPSNRTGQRSKSDGPGLANSRRLSGRPGRIASGKQEEEKEEEKEEEQGRGKRGFKIKSREETAEAAGDYAGHTRTSEGRGYDMASKRSRTADEHKMGAQNSEGVAKATASRKEEAEKGNFEDATPRKVSRRSREPRVSPQRVGVGVGQFARKWLNTAPGGAFANEGGQANGHVHPRRRVDVLQWDI